MVKPSDVVDALVAMLQAIPDLVDALNGDSSLIYAYLDTYPQNVDREKAVHDMESPSVMVVYEDFGIGSEGQAATTNHRLTIYARPAADVSGSDLAYLIVSGVPTGEPTNLITSAEIHSDLLPMRMDGRFGPQRDVEGVEYWSASISFNEKWG
jgi:hypothetical protein